MHSRTEGKWLRLINACVSASERVRLSSSQFHFRCVRKRNKMLAWFNTTFQLSKQLINVFDSIGVELERELNFHSFPIHCVLSITFTLSDCFIIDEYTHTHTPHTILRFIFQQSIKLVRFAGYKFLETFNETLLKLSSR